MKDMHGKEVNNGDFMVEGHEEFCYIFKVKDNKPILIGRDGIEILEKYTINNLKESQKIIEEKIKIGYCPNFMKNYFNNTINRVLKLSTEQLMLLDNSKKEHIYYTNFFRED